ncbi:MAG: biopolymer transporter ExbD [Deltaproteobacteria bacterium]|nr:biopolymer transporter ExbD [Deltaproteobacteria bacterium]
MARKPSDRRSYKEEGMELNLTPMMNLIGILIPVLLVSAAFLEIAVINVAAPAIGSAPEEEKPPDDKPPLNLTVTITDKGYTLAGSGGVLGGEPKPGAEAGPTIPITQKQMTCGGFLETVPPPRSKNKAGGPCKTPEESRMFLVYDKEALTRKLIEIKDAFPDERRVIIAAEPDTEYESITDVMDASREVKDPSGEVRTLFDEVVLSPGLS